MLGLACCCWQRYLDLYHVLHFNFVFDCCLVIVKIIVFLLCSIQYILSQIDNCIQYGEDADVKVKDFDPEDIDD